MLVYRFATVVLLLIGAAVIGTQAVEAADALTFLQQKYQQRHSAFAAEMEELASEAEVNSSAEVAAEILRLIPPLEEQTTDVDALPDRVREELPASLPEAERRWRSQLHRIRSDYAQDLYTLSRRALGEKQVRLAYNMIREVAFHDPDHRLARQLLGYVEHEDRWVTPFAQSMLRRGYTHHEQFGWLPETHVPRYEQGQRYFRGRWISAAQEATQRHDFRHAWEIPSDHFLIKTNQSLERGVELSQALEKFHQYFRREFAAVFDSPQQMRELLSAGRGRPQQHEIHYYQSQQEFIFRLRAKQPGIEVSNGLYLPKDRTAYFYYNPQDLDGNVETLYHEVTHQLLSESHRKLIEVGRSANFWLIEGIACYLESFEVDDNGVVSVGDPRHVRLHWARERRLRENFHVPLTQFTRLGSSDFQPSNTAQLQSTRGDGLLQKLYSQSTGVTHFFMHYEDGIYRDALIEHLGQIYSPDPRTRANPEPLNRLTGVSFAELDRQYLSYLTEMQATLDTEAASQEP